MTDENAEIARIVESARRLGVELDESETIQWLTALAATPEGSDLTVDTASGTFGHRVSMLDFSPRDLARFRRIGAIVEVTGPEGVAQSALALSGSAAQSKIQSFPGDADYFQRLNIKAATREEACAIMARLMRESFVVREKGSDTWKSMEEGFGEHMGDIRVAMEIPSTETIKQAVIAGMGISFLSAHTVSKELEAKSLRLLHVQGFPLMLSWYVVHRRDKRLPPVAEAFREFLLSDGATLISQIVPFDPAL